MLAVRELSDRRAPALCKGLNMLGISESVRTLSRGVRRASPIEDHS